MQPKVTKRKLRFCTECGNELDEFWSDPRAENLKELIQCRVKCLQSGRPADRMCSKLFIAGAHTPLPSTRKKKSVSPKRISDLKNEVMVKINGGKGKGTKKK
jgi:hypothetical protein